MGKVPRARVENMVVLATAVGEDGVTAVGIGPGEQWVRPVRGSGTLQLTDLCYPNNTVLRAFDIAQLAIVQRRPAPPYVENAIADFDYARPRLAGQVAPSQRAAWLAAHAEPAAPAVAAIYQRQERSLALIEVTAVYCTVRRDPKGGLVTKVWAEELQQPRPIPCTGVHWRAVARRLLGEETARNFEWPQLRALLGCQRAYLLISLSNPHPGEYWPTVLSLETSPGYDATVDYRNL